MDAALIAMSVNSVMKGQVPGLPCKTYIQKAFNHVN